MFIATKGELNKTLDLVSKKNRFGIEKSKSLCFVNETHSGLLHEGFQLLVRPREVQKQ